MKIKASFTVGGFEFPSTMNPKPAPTKNAFLPVTAIVALKQHPRHVAKSLVKKGDMVIEGQIIGRSYESRFSLIHSPIPGVIKDHITLKLPGGDLSEAIVIELKGSFEKLGKRTERYLWKTLNKSDILKVIEENGIAASLYSQVPFIDMLYSTLKSRQHTDVLILNAIETEPWLNSERRVLRDCFSEILESLDILSKLLSPKKIIIAGEIEDLHFINTADLKPFDFAPVPELVSCLRKYPQENPNQLLEALFGKSEKIPSYFMISPSTAIEIHNAVVLNKPVMERYITVSGDAVVHPAVLKTRIGTPIGDLFEECGGFKGNPGSIIMNGPLRGSAVSDLDLPIMKTTSAILAFAHNKTRLKHYRCIRCGRCMECCPESLEPATIWRMIGNGIKQTDQKQIEFCTSCGLCSYICPSRLPLTEAFKSAKRVQERGVND